MKAHWQYLKYVSRHKWFVFLAGMRMGPGWPNLFWVSWFWQLVRHDWSKFLPSEWNPYVQNFYGKKLTLPDSDNEVILKGRAEAFECAWNFHQKRNRHHWQFWVMFNDNAPTRRDSPDPHSPDAPERWSVLYMPMRYVREMVADWMGAGRAITGHWCAWDWYEKNKHQIILHPLTRYHVENLLVEQKTAYQRREQKYGLQEAEKILRGGA